jgi:hypothetical protein
VKLRKLRDSLAKPPLLTGIAGIDSGSLVDLGCPRQI